MLGALRGVELDRLVTNESGHRDYDEGRRREKQLCESEGGFHGAIYSYPTERRIEEREVWYSMLAVWLGTLVLGCRR